MRNCSAFKCHAADLQAEIDHLEHSSKNRSRSVMPDDFDAVYFATSADNLRQLELLLDHGDDANDELTCGRWESAGESGKVALGH